MKKVLHPFINFLNRFTFAKKFLLIFIFIFVPMTVVTLLYYVGIREEIKIAENEQAGLVFLKEIHSLIQNTQQHRGLSSGFLNGDTEIEPLLNEKSKEIEVLYASIEQLILKNKDDYNIQNDYNTLLESWKQLTGNLRTLDAQTSIRLHGELIVDIFDLATEIAGESELFLDKELVNYSTFAH